MCGIIGYTGARDVTPILLDGLRRLEYRGYDSAGVAIHDLTTGGLRLARCKGKIAGLAQQLAASPLRGASGVGHTRWATHGRPSEQNAHPHRAGHIAVVHNGIIENHQALRARLAAAGAAFTSETDSEVIAHLLELEMQERGCDLLTAVQRATPQLHGTWALAAISDQHPGELIIARHAAPLLIGLGGPGIGEDSPSAENFVASDAAALLAYTRLVIDLDDGDIARIRPGSVEIFDRAGEPARRPRRRVEWSPMAAERQGFKHFMLKEIHEQPRAIRDTVLGCAASDDDVLFDDLRLSLRAGARLVIVGCGTSWHAALTGKYLIERLARIRVEVDLASEFRYRDPILDAGEIVLAISQSGETADTLAALKEAKERGAHTLALCNVVGSTITRVADQVLFTRAGPEISVASTKAFTTQLTALTLLAIHLGRRSGALSSERAAALLTGLRDLPRQIDNMLGQGAAIRTVARRYVAARDCLFLGRGLCFPVALEGALKLKEISYIHAEGYASGEMKHGPIALIDEQVPVIVLALQGAGYQKVLSNLEEVRARGGRIIAIASVGDHAIADVADDVLLVPEVAEELQPIVAAIPLQLLAYHFADLKGTDVDQPRNLAKSVTVE
ncbi:MAG: glutamine--fructose-6-phosphate transaminase (isomerizing) [Nannocystis sp.]|nr:glutamine--fructose-6-phosphate transaminase (isomerizing) [Nannocystis sp.]